MIVGVKMPVADWLEGGLGDRVCHVISEAELIVIQYCMCATNPPSLTILVNHLLSINIRTKHWSFLFIVINIFHFLLGSTGGIFMDVNFWLKSGSSSKLVISSGYQWWLANIRGSF